MFLSNIRVEKNKELSKMKVKDPLMKTIKNQAIEEMLHNAKVLHDDNKIDDDCFERITNSLNKMRDEETTENNIKRFNIKRFMKKANY